MSWRQKVWGAVVLLLFLAFLFEFLHLDRIVLIWSLASPVSPVFILLVMNNQGLVPLWVKNWNDSSHLEGHAGIRLTEKPHSEKGYFLSDFYLMKFDLWPTFQIYIFIFTAGGRCYWLKFSLHSVTQRHKYHIELAESEGWMRRKQPWKNLRLR